MITVRAMHADDWPAVQAIYAAGIATGRATFEIAPPSWEQFDAAKLDQHRLVAVDELEQVVGWVAVAPTSTRAAYAGVVEHSIFIDPQQRGRGIGRTLLEKLITSTEAAGIWTVQSGIFPTNEASLALHDRCGFRRIGYRERIGLLNGVWSDVILVERRSQKGYEE